VRLRRLAAAHGAQGLLTPFSLSSASVAVDAPRVPLITLAVSMFGGAALGAVQARACVRAFRRSRTR